MPKRKRPIDFFCNSVLFLKHILPFCFDFPKQFCLIMILLKTSFPLLPCLRIYEESFFFLTKYLSCYLEIQIFLNAQHPLNLEMKYKMVKKNEIGK